MEFNKTPVRSRLYSDSDAPLVKEKFRSKQIAKPSVYEVDA